MYETLINSELSEAATALNNFIVNQDNIKKLNSQLK